MNTQTTGNSKSPTPTQTEQTAPVPNLPPAESGGEDETEIPEDAEDVEEEGDEDNDQAEDRPQPILPAGNYMGTLSKMSFAPIGGAVKTFRVKMAFQINADEQGQPLHEAFEGITADQIVELPFREFTLADAIDLRDKRNGTEFLADTFGRPVKGANPPRVIGGFMKWNFSIDPKKIKFGEQIEKGGGRCMIVITRAPSTVKGNNVVPERNYIQSISAIPSEADDADFMKNFGVSAATADKMQKSAAAAAATGSDADGIRAALQAKGGPKVLRVKPKAPASK